MTAPHTTATTKKEQWIRIRREQKKKTKRKKCLRLDHTHARARVRKYRQTQAREGNIQIYRGHRRRRHCRNIHRKVTKIYIKTYTRAEPCVCDDWRKSNVFSGVVVVLCVCVIHTNANHQSNIPSDTDCVCVSVRLFSFCCSLIGFAVKISCFFFLSVESKIYQTNALCHPTSKFIECENTLRANGV